MSVRNSLEHHQKLEQTNVQTRVFLMSTCNRRRKAAAMTVEGALCFYKEHFIPVMLALAGCEPRIPQTALESFLC